MTVVVVDVAAKTGGALTVLMEFYDFVRQHGGEHKWVFFLSGDYLKETENISVVVTPKVGVSWPERIKWELFYAAKTVKSLNPDVVFSLENLTVFRLKGVPQYVYLHQPIPLQYEKRFSFFKKSERIMAAYQVLYRPLVNRSVRASRGVFVQSGWMKKRLVEKYRHEASKIHVVPVSIDDGPIKKADFIIGRKVSLHQFIYPAGTAVYKNHACIIEAVRQLTREGYQDFEVVFTLPEDSPAVRKAKSLKQIHSVGWLDRKMLLSLYATHVLLFASYIESFGLPLAESMAAHGVMIAADCAYAHDLLGDYPNVYYFDPFDAKTLKQAMKRLLDGEMTYIEYLEPSRGNSWAYVMNILISAL